MGHVRDYDLPTAQSWADGLPNGELISWLNVMSVDKRQQPYQRALAREAAKRLTSLTDGDQ
jgi:hypothetical protein